MTLITVTGAAEGRLPADRAMIHASASFRESTREVAVSAANAAHAALVARAKALVAAGEASRYDAAAVSTYSNSWRDENNERVVEHQANANVTIVLTALDRAGEVAAELTDSGADVRIDWELSTEARRDLTARLRGAAVEDARSAANDFAAAIGAASVELQSLSTTGRGGGAPRMMATRMAMDSAAPEVTVHEITVTVEVEAQFTAA